MFLIDRYLRAASRRRTHDSLSQLDPRLLRDMGLSPYDVTLLARGRHPARLQDGRS